MKPQALLIRPLLAMGILGLGAACDSKATECNKLADIVNEGVAAMGKIQGGDPNDNAQRAKDARSMADLADKTKTQIDGIGIKTEGLVAKAGAYQEMMAQMGTVGGEVADLLEKRAAVDGKLAEADKAFNESQAALQEGCKEQTPDCTKIAELVGKEPETPSGEQDPSAMLGKFAQDLGALQLEDDATKKVVADHKTATEAFAKLLKEKNDIETSFEAAAKKMDEVVEKEDKIVADLNAFCGG